MSTYIHMCSDIHTYIHTYTEIHIYICVNGDAACACNAACHYVRVTQHATGTCKHPGLRRER